MEGKIHLAASVGLFPRFLSLTQLSDVSCRDDKGKPRVRVARAVAPAHRPIIGQRGSRRGCCDPRITYHMCAWECLFKERVRFPRDLNAIYPRFPLETMVWAPLATCLGCKLYERLSMPEDRGKGFSPVQVITTGLGNSAARGFT